MRVYRLLIARVQKGLFSFHPKRAQLAPWGYIWMYYFAIKIVCVVVNILVMKEMETTSSLLSTLET